MKAIQVMFAALAASAALAGAANAEAPRDEIVFTYTFDRSQLSTDEGVRAVYKNLERQARRACAMPGTRGVLAVDDVCVAELVDKVVAVTGSAALEAQYEGSRLALLMREDAEQFAAVGR